MNEFRTETIDTPLIQVLHVEDNSADTRLVEELLREAEQESYQIAQADCLGDAKNRLLSADEAKPDVILLDLGLPDSQGLETLTGILRIASDIPIVVLTGLDDDAQGRNAVSRGAEDYLRKSEISSPHLLRRTLQYAISRHRRSAEHSIGVASSDQEASLFDKRWFDDVGKGVVAPCFRDQHPDAFAALLQRYLPLLTTKNRHAANNVLGNEADAILEHLARENAQPSDLVDLHSNALRLAMSQDNSNSKELRDHARSVSLTMMARLASIYRQAQ